MLIGLQEPPKKEVLRFPQQQIAPYLQLSFSHLKVDFGISTFLAALLFENPCDSTCGVYTVSSFVLQDTIQYNTVQYNTIRYDTIRYDTIRYDTIRYNTILYSRDKKIKTKTPLQGEIVRLALYKNRKSMTARGYCCCYLEHCSKTNHISAIKGVIQRAKYENVLDLQLIKTCRLVSSIAQSMLISKFVRLSVT